MVKIFPTRFILETEDSTGEQLWQWINEKIYGTQVTQIVPLEMERSASKNLVIIKGLIEVHCSENITTKELEQLLKPYPSFLQHLHLTFQ